MCSKIYSNAGNTERKYTFLQRSRCVYQLKDIEYNKKIYIIDIKYLFVFLNPEISTRRRKIFVNKIIHAIESSSIFGHAERRSLLIIGDEIGTLRHEN